jgi:hypothetical protein
LVYFKIFDSNNRWLAVGVLYCHSIFFIQVVKLNMNSIPIIFLCLVFLGEFRYFSNWNHSYYKKLSSGATRKQCHPLLFLWAGYSWMWNSIQSNRQRCNNRKHLNFQLLLCTYFGDIFVRFRIVLFLDIGVYDQY